MPVTVTHVITGLGAGGAESALLRLLEGTDRSRFPSRVVSLMSGGIVDQSLRDLGVPTTTLALDRPARAPAAIPRLVAELRRHQPDVVQCWMYHADLLGGLTARALGIDAVAWGIRQGDFDRRTTRWSTRGVARACARLSRRVPSAIVCVTPQAADAHAAIGYDASKMVVIPNGIPLPDLDPGVRESVRAELGCPSDALLVARVARLHPHKDYPLLLRAFAAVARAQPAAHLVAVGPGVDPGAGELTAMVQELDLGGRVSLLGQRRDVMRVLAAADVAVSTSNGEGFPNTVAEAMSVGVPAVVTDVGASAALVGDTGWVVPVGVVEPLVDALLEALRLPAAERARRGAGARRRVASQYGVPAMVAGYEELYERLANRPRRRRRADR